MKYAGISFVAAKKLILNVSKIRLRLIFSRASDIPRLFQKAYGKYVFKSGRGDCIYFVLHKNKCSTYQNGQGRPCCPLPCASKSKETVQKLKFLNAARKRGGGSSGTQFRISVQPYNADIRWLSDRYTKYSAGCLLPV